MAVCPFAVWMPLTENHTQGSIDPRAVILHTAVSDASSLFQFFQHNSNLESHFYVDKNGRIEQYMDTRRRADANKNANSFAVSIETWDGRDPDRNAWTSKQVSALIRLVRWICDVHDIPKVQIPTAYGSGIGWHVQFGAPGPWTPVAKSCPGAKRIAQTKNVIIPGVKSGGGGSAPGTGDEDMPLNDADLDAIYQTVWWGRGGEDLIHDRMPGMPDAWPEGILGSLNDRIIRQQLKPMRAQLAQLLTLVASRDEVSAEDIAKALQAGVAAELGDVVRDVLEEALEGDNADLADAIVKKIADRLGGDEVGEA